MRLFILLLLTSCASGSFDYKKPKPLDKPINSKTLNKNFNKSWNELIESLSESVYGTEHINKESGFIDVKFTISDPTEYIDCGRYIGSFKNARVDEKYDIPFASSYMKVNIYENGVLYPLEKETNLSGKANLYLKRIDEKVIFKVNIKYILDIKGNKKYLGGDYAYHNNHYNYQIPFSTNESSSVRRGNSEIQCYSNGMLEKYFLNMIKK